MIKIKQISFSTCEDSEGLYGLGEDGLLYLWDYEKEEIREEEMEEKTKTEKVVTSYGHHYIYRYGWKLQEDKLNK